MNIDPAHSHSTEELEAFSTEELEAVTKAIHFGKEMLLMMTRTETIGAPASVRALFVAQAGLLFIHAAMRHTEWAMSVVNQTMGIISPTSTLEPGEIPEEIYERTLSAAIQVFWPIESQAVDVAV